MEGILQTVAQDVYSMQIKLDLLRGREDGSCDHEVGPNKGFDGVWVPHTGLM